MQAARAARALPCLLGPGPPVAAVTATIERAGARDREVACADGVERRGEAVLRQALPAADHLAVPPGGQDRPALARAWRGKHGALGKVQGHAAAQFHRPGDIAPRRHQHRAALGHGGDGRGDGAGRLGRRLGRVCRVCDGAVIADVHHSGASGGLESEGREALRLEMVERGGREVVQRQTHLRRHAPGDGLAGARQLPRNGRGECVARTGLWQT